MKKLGSSIAAIGLTLALFVTPASAQVKVIAGGPGNDQIQPYVDQYLGIWDKYGLKIDFEGQNWLRAAQRMASGDFDAGYISFASAIRYRAAGMPVVIVGTSSANCTTLVSSPSIKSVADLKGKKIGIVAKFDVDYMVFTRMVLPRYGLSVKDVELVSSPSTDIAGAILTGSLAAAYTFEPYGTFAIQKGAKRLLPGSEWIDKSKINTELFRSALIMKEQFIKEHPDLAKKIVWAHMDAMHVLKNEPENGMKVLQHYNDKMDPELIKAAYATCSWNYSIVPQAWIEMLAKWEKEDKIVERDVGYKEITDFSMRDSYPGYPAWKK